MFQWDAVDASPDLNGQMPSKPSKCLFDIIGGRHERIYTESYLSLDLFSLTFKNIFLDGGAIAPIAPIAPYGSLTVHITVRRN